MIASGSLARWRRCAVALALVVTLTLLVVGYLWHKDTSVALLCDDWQILNVHLAATPPAQVKAVRCEVVSDSFVREEPNPNRNYLLQPYPLQPFLGEPVDVEIPVTQRVSPVFHRVLHYNQPRNLLVIVELGDRRRVGKYVAVPDLRETRVVHVTIP